MILSTVSVRFFLASLVVSAVCAQTAPNAEQLAKRLTEMHDAWGVRAGSANMTLAIVEQSHTALSSATGWTLQAFLLAVWLLWSLGPSRNVNQQKFYLVSHSTIRALPFAPGAPAPAVTPQSPMTQLRFLSALLQESQSASVLFRRMVR
jgi:hypothetical protein